MHDRDIRKALKAQVLRNDLKDPNTVVIDELGLRHGKSRVDVGIINGAISGLEIKSAYDNLRRLPRQVAVFNTVLDYVTLVLTEKHIEKARAIIPEWWGVLETSTDMTGTIRFDCKRAAKKNPSPEALAVAKLLWREEALNVLEQMDLAAGLRSKPRIVIYRKLTHVTTLTELQAIVRQQLRIRKSWRSGEPRTLGGD